jgi:hypothetical protein
VFLQRGQQPHIFKGGDTMASKMNPGFMAMMAKKKGADAPAKGKDKMPAALAKHAGKPASKAHAGLKAGGMTKMAMGGGVHKMPDGSMMAGGMKHGGMAKMKHGGTTKMAKGGGIETKGKTKGKMV